MLFASDFLNVCHASSGSSWQLPWLRAQASKPGPCLWLTACLHGDEPVGMALIHEVMQWLQQVGLQQGQVNALPCVNPSGLTAGTRCLPESQEDLNRCFPGNPHTPGGALAMAVWQAVQATQPDLVLDLHGDWAASLPYALLEPMPDSLGQQRLQAVAQTLGQLMVRDHEVLPGAFAWELLQAGTLALTLELGPGQGMGTPWVQLGLAGVQRLLHQWGMVKAAPTLLGRNPFPASLLGQVLQHQSQPLANATGLLRLAAQPGEQILPGQLLGEIVSPQGARLSQLVSPGWGVMLGHGESAWVQEGQVLWDVALLPGSITAG